MLAKKYHNDNKETIKLSDIQKKEKQKIINKIENKEFQFENILHCQVCKGDNFDKIAEKDRYGIYSPVVICKECGLIFSNPRFTQESFNEFYNENYRKLYGGEEKPNIKEFESHIPHGQLIFDYIYNSEIINKDSKILEIGCGGGWILYSFFKAEYKNIKGIDLGKEYVEFGKETYGLNLFNLDISKETEQYDLIIMSHVFEHILDLNNFLKKLSTNLTLGGYLYIEVPGIYDTHNSYERLINSLQSAHTFYFTLKTLKNVMNKNGYELVKGDELIRSIWKYTGNFSDINESDYLNSMNYLKHIEKNYVFYKFFNSKNFNKLIFILKKIHLYKILRLIKKGIGL